MTATATLRELLDERGPALEPALAIEVARGILASVFEGPFDTPPPPAIDPSDVHIVETARGVAVRFEGPARLSTVGELLYLCLVGGPARRQKDGPTARPRPLGKLRLFMGGGPVSPSLERFVHDMIDGKYASADEALAALSEVQA